MRHLTICERIMREKGKANLNFALCLLNGPPRVGKSTFLSRITGRPLPRSADDEYLISETPSTGVAERVLQVVIKKSSFTIALAPQSPKAPQAPRSEINWQIITLSQEAVMMLKAILSSQPSLAIEQLESQMPPTSTSDLAPTTSEGLSSEDTSTTAAETNRQPIAVEPKMAVVSGMGLFKFGKHKKSPPRIPGYQVPLEVFQKALKSKEWATAEEFLKHALNLYFTDVGGQPEFQEVLPAIIAGPSIFFIVFKLPDRLDQKYRVQYVESLSKKSVTYESSFTVLESILQSLASIASMCSNVQVSCNHSKLIPIKPQVVLVGTHKDQADAKHIRKVQRELKECLGATDYVQKDGGIIRFASEDEPVLTINNLSKDETDAVNIRQLVEKIASDPAFTIPVPAPWLALLLSLRLIESSVISYDDCLSMAKDCGINGDEELKEALWFLHTKLGVIRYFGEIPELSDIVICDPQLIFDKITALISRTFTFEETQDVHASKEFRDKGIFPARIIDEISSRSNEPLSRKQLVILLKHLRVIAPIYKDEERQDQPQESKTPSHYIVPCVLAHAPAQIEIESTSKGKKTSKVIRKFTNIFKRRPRPSATESAPAIPSVCILFKCGYCPKGMFGALIADLMGPAGNRLRWRLLDDAIYRDQVSFHVGPEHHTVRITFFISFLEVCISADTDHARSAQQSNAKAVCNKIRRELEQSLVSVSRTLNYGSGAGIYFGFRCSCSAPAKCDEENPVVMKCDRCRLAIDLQDTHKLWFGEEVHVSIDDLEKMLSAAWEARAKWYNIGLQLKIGAGTLDAIETASHSIDDQFRVMLSTWLRRDEPRPTLSLLANALRSPMVGYQQLAQQILAQY